MSAPQIRLMAFTAARMRHPYKRVLGGAGSRADTIKFSGIK